MSVVIACATTTRAVIKCDGRAMNMNTGKILSENTNKLFRIGENCVIGVTGNLEYCVIVIEAFKRLLGEKDAMENIGLLNSILQQTVDTYNKPSYFIIIGKLNDKIVACAFDYNDRYKIVHDASPTVPGLDRYLVSGDKGMNDMPDFGKVYDCEKSLESNMNAYIRMIAKTSPAVNDVISTEKIRL